MGAESRPDGSSPSRRLKRTTAIPTAPKTRTTTATATPRYTWKSELNPAAVSCGRSTGRLLPAPAGAQTEDRSRVALPGQFRCRAQEVNIRGKATEVAR